MDTQTSTVVGSHSKRVALGWAWVLAVSASAVAPLVAGPIGLPFAAVAWCLAASALALITGRLLNERGWYDGAAWVTIGTLFFWADQITLTPARLGSLAWVLYLVVVPTRLFVRAQRSLRSASMLCTGWPPPRSSAAVIRTLTLLSGAAMVGRTIETYSESEPTGPVADVAGCYRVAVSPWMPRSRFGNGMSAVIPDMIQLDSMRGPAPAPDPSRPWSNENGFRAFERGERLIRPGWNGAATWRTWRGSLQLGWTNGFHGAGSDLVRVGSHFVGQIDEFTDEGPSLLPSALIWLRPTGCAEPNAQGKFRARIV